MITNKKIFKFLFYPMALFLISSCTVVDGAYMFNRDLNEENIKETEESVPLQPVVFENEPRALTSKKVTLNNGKSMWFSGYISTRNLRDKVYFPSVPSLIQNLITNDTYLLKYRERLFSSWSGLNISTFPVGFSYNRQTNKWDYDSRGVKELYDSKNARAELFKYMIEIYKSIANDYPIYVVKEFDSRLNRADEFLRQYSKNRAYYLSKNQSLVQEIGEDFAWLSRRIEKNNVSVNEMRSYILSLKSIIEEQIERNVSNVDCLDKRIINNELLIYDADNSVIIQTPNGKMVSINERSIKMVKRGNYYEISYWRSGSTKTIKKYDVDLNELY